MIYLTGDIHGPLDFDRIRPENLILRGVDCQPEDILLVCGDFGIPWTDPAQGSDREMLEEIARWPYTVVFEDGNHDKIFIFSQKIHLEVSGAALGGKKLYRSDWTVSVQYPMRWEFWR